MKKLLDITPRWFPALLMMLVIFGFSSRPGDDLPSFGGWDYFVKKGGHAVGYGLLALAYLHALPKRNYVLAWFLALLFSATDEFHQSFVPGRNASVIDVLVFDNLGAMAGLFIHARWSSSRERHERHIETTR
ncbi:MAG: VanZ family protein [Anaerolineales bacterium]|nr:MAG: VanZ family protein [Anaerolineales bacterium]